MEGEAVVGHVIAKSCVAARVRTNPSAHEMRLAPPGPRLLCHLHQASFLQCLVILLRDWEVLSLGDGLIHALRLVCRHQRFPLALSDSRLPSLQHVVGRRLRNAPGKRKTKEVLTEILLHLRQLAGEVGVQENFVLRHQVDRLRVVAVWRYVYLWREHISITSLSLSRILH